MSNNHIIEQILANADIVKIIGKHVELKRSGNEFKGCCPFHGEKTPSFFVNPQKNLYNCFGCGVKGNALTFLKEYENLTASEALQELSRQTGIELPKEPINKNHTYQRKTTPKPATPTSPTNPITPQTVSPTGNTDLSNDLTPPLEEVQAIDNFLPSFDHAMYHIDNANDYLTHDFDQISANESLSDWYNGYDYGQALAVNQQADGSTSLYDLLAQVSLFYRTQLSQTSTAMQYFVKRGLTQTTLDTFELGYAPADWQHLERAFPHDIEGLKILGLIRDSQKGNTYNLLRHRVIFPIRDNQGRIVGFAGRALNDEDMPKYINSSDSPVFHKQYILYGLYEGRKAKAKNWLVVEGYMDVISLHQAGVYGAVASMGTAIATTQIDRLLQLNPVLTLSFDGDSAGQKAAWRAMEVALPVLTDGKELRFLTLPNNHDPDSFVKAYGSHAMQQQIDTAIPLSQYVFSVLSRQHDINIAEGRGKLLTEVSELTKKLPKGSYGWLLREDMRSRMGLGKRAQARTAHDALVNFESNLTAQLVLQLCFLYQPELLGEKINQQPNHALIEQIFSLSGADQLPFFAIKQLSKEEKTELSDEEKQQKIALYIQESQKKSAKHLQDFPLQPITWQNLLDDKSQILVDWIQHNQTAISEFTQQLEAPFGISPVEPSDTQSTETPYYPTLDDNDLDDISHLTTFEEADKPPTPHQATSSIDEYELINAKAHFILAGLPDTIRKPLVSRWSLFFTELSRRFVSDISVLVIEIMAGEIIATLQNRITAEKEIANKQYYNRQMQTINQWYQTWLQQKED